MSYPPQRIVALSTNPVEGASTRFRIVQWRDDLVRAGFDLRLDPFFTDAAARVIYRQGHARAKMAHLARGTARRCAVLMRAAREADLIFVHREAFPLGWPILLGRLRGFDGAIVYDYDDAMFLPQRRGRPILPWLERLDTPARLMAMSHVVLAGNPFLAEYARAFASDVVLLPTCIDTVRFVPPASRPVRPRPRLGWIGSHTTARYLERLLPALEQVAAVVPFDLHVAGVMKRLRAERFTIVQHEWALDREVRDFQDCDVGIYPLSDDDWSRGKCGFKAIQFMACGVPVVASGVGVTQQIIRDGDNGLLAATESEWVDKLVLLLRDPALRERLSAAGRRTVECQYSVNANAHVLVSALRRALDRANGRPVTSAASLVHSVPGVVDPL